MLIKEYRIPLPMTVEEYQIAQLYSVSEMSKHETGGGEGVEIIKNEPFHNKPLLGSRFSEGQYTYKIYHLHSKVPSLIRLLAPKGAFELHEEAWNAYPYCKTVIKNPTYMKENFVAIVESLHLNDNGSTENALELDAERLKQREIVVIDIANDPIAPADYIPDQDPSKFKSKKTGRGPLDTNWIKTCKPVMTCYKLVSITFKWFGLQNRVEQFLHKSNRRLFLLFHKKVFCWTDEWYGLKLDDIRKLEETTKQELEKTRGEGTVRGMKPPE